MSLIYLALLGQGLVILALLYSQRELGRKLTAVVRELALLTAEDRSRDS